VGVDTNGERKPVTGVWDVSPIVVLGQGQSPLNLNTFHLWDAQQKQQIRSILRILQTGESSCKLKTPTSSPSSPLKTCTGTASDDSPDRVAK